MATFDKVRDIVVDQLGIGNRLAGQGIDSIGQLLNVFSGMRHFL